jgi:hypothetical protein
LYSAFLGLVTNAPTCDWHLTNLRNYLQLTPAPRQTLKVGGLGLSPLGSGMIEFGTIQQPVLDDDRDRQNGSLWASKGDQSVKRLIDVSAVGNALPMHSSNKSRFVPFE